MPTYFHASFYVGMIVERLATLPPPPTISGGTAPFRPIPKLSENLHKIPDEMNTERGLEVLSICKSVSNVE